jgi:hypothetical protein
LDGVDENYIMSSSTTVEYTALPDDTYTFCVKAVDRADNTDPTEATYTFTVDGSTPVPDVPTYVVSFNVQAGYGSLTVQANGENITSDTHAEEGSTVVFTATPDAGNQVKDWVVDGVSTGLTHLTYTIHNLQKAVDVKVEFENLPVLSKQYIVTFSKIGKGTLTAKLNGESIAAIIHAEEGSNVVFTAMPAAGNQVKDWMIDGVSTGLTHLTYTVNNLQQSVDVTVVFAALPVKAAQLVVTFPPENEFGSLTAQANGKDINSGDKVVKGNTVIFTAVPAESYQINDWVVDGVSTGLTDTTYIINNLQSAVYVSVKFTPIPKDTLPTVDDEEDTDVDDKPLVPEDEKGELQKTGGWMLWLLGLFLLAVSAVLIKKKPWQA